MYVIAVRGRQVEPRVVIGSQRPSPGKQVAYTEIHHLLPSLAVPDIPGIRTITWKIVKGQRQHPSLISLYSLQLNPLKEQSYKLVNLPPLLIHPLPIMVEANSGCCDTPESAAWLVAFGARQKCQKHTGQEPHCLPYPTTGRELNPIFKILKEPWLG